MANKIEFSEIQTENMIELYKTHQSLNKVADLLNLNKKTVQKHLRYHHIELTPKQPNKKPVNLEFFKTLTIESSYYLGLFIADGSIGSSNGSCYFNLALNEEDSYIIEKLKDLIAPEHTLISDRKLKKLSVGDNRLAVIIASYGINVLDKTYNLGYCEDLFKQLCETNTLNHFIRGFLDGDGCVYVDSKRGYNHSVSFVGHINFLTTLQKHINSILFTKGCLRIDKTGKYSEKMNNNFCTLSYTGYSISVTILKWLYENKGEFYLKRKYNKYLDVIKSRESGKISKTDNPYPSIVEI